jgi:hypothetical protein
MLVFMRPKDHKYNLKAIYKKKILLKRHKYYKYKKNSTLFRFYRDFANKDLLFYLILFDLN